MNIYIPVKLFFYQHLFPIKDISKTPLLLAPLLITTGEICRSSYSVTAEICIGWITSSDVKQVATRTYRRYFFKKNLSINNQI